jgi:hypothetical protein
MQPLPLCRAKDGLRLQPMSNARGANTSQPDISLSASDSFAPSEGNRIALNAVPPSPTAD